MIKNCLFLFMLVLLFNCTTDPEKRLNPIDFKPSNSNLFFNGSSFNQLKEDIFQNYFINQSTKYSRLQKLDSLLLQLQYFDSDKPACISVSNLQGESPDILFVIQADSSVINADSLTDLKSDSFKTEDYEYIKLSIGLTKMYSIAKGDNQFYGTNLDELLALNSISKQINDNDNVNKIVSDENSLSFDMRHDSIFTIFPWIPKDSLIISHLADRMMLNFKNEQDATIINGVVYNTSANSSLLAVLESTAPIENSFSKIVPENAESVLSYGFNDISNLSENLSKLKILDSLSGIFNEFRSVIEIGSFTVKEKSAVFIKTINPESTLDYLPNKTLMESYRDVELFKIDNNPGFTNFINPLIGTHSYSYMFNIEEFIILSDDLELLKSSISSFQNETSLFYSESFRGLMKNMSDEASVFAYYNADGLNTLFNQNFNEDLNLELDSNSASAVQLITDNGFAHINGVFGQKGDFVASNDVIEELQISLDAEIISEPQFIENHLGRGKDIAVQDVNNVLYLFDSRGMQLFKRTLDGSIFGNIETMDAFGNGRKQLVFATSKTVYAIARNGQDLRNFPMKFRDDITQPLSLFDYDSNKRYRVLVTQGNELLMLDKNGKRVRGFNFSGAKDNITSQPKHIRIKRKDYIVFKQGDQLMILSRTGKSRLRINERFNFSDNGIYSYNDTFSFTDKSGTFISIDLNGKINKELLELNEEHTIDATSRTLAILNDNVLRIRSKNIELDFGNYTSPKIFIENNKIYVNITDLQTNKVYLFDSQGEPIDHFPVYGNSSIDMGNFDKDNNIEIVVKSGSDEILVYEMK